MNAVSIVTETKTESKTEFVVATYESAFETWLNERDLSDRTLRLYLIGLHDFSTWFEKRHDVALSPDQITSLDVKWYRDHLVKERKLKANSVNSYLAAVRAYCKWAVEREMIYRNPSTTIKGVHISDLDHRPHWLSEKEQQDLRQAAEKEVNQALKDFRGDKSSPGCMRAYRDLAIVELMLNSGLRLSEVAALTVEDVVIRPRSGSVAVRWGKGGKSRTVPFNKEGRQYVNDWLEVRGLALGDQKVDALFISQKGHEALSSRAIARVVERLGKLAGLTITPHQLRHSFAKNLVRTGHGLQDVRMVMGHESIGTTAIYTVASDAELQAMTESVSSVE